MNAIEIQALAHAAHDDVRAAIRGWLGGVPRCELALLNRLTERLGRHRRGCRVGYRRFRVVPALAVMHAKGSNNTDMYGSDLAVTLSIPVDGYLKTAMFQLKRARNGKAQLDRRQLDEAIRLEETANRSFVLAVDDNFGEVRVAAVRDLLAKLPDSVASPTCDVRDPEWFPLDVWLFAWIECTVGDRSDPSGQGIERMLECAFGETGTDDRDPLGQFLDEAWIDWQLARSWVRLSLVPVPSVEPPV